MNAGHNEIIWVINKIKKKFNITKKGNIIRYDIDEKREDKNTPSYYDQIDILEKIDIIGAIKIKEKSFNKDLARDKKNKKNNSFILEIMQEKFEEFCNKYKIKEDESTSKNYIKLSENEITFDDNTAIIMVGKKECPMPPYKNEHYFSRAMFKRNVNEFIDWSIIYQEMTQSEIEEAEKDKRTVQDTMYRINNRIKEIIKTENDLFTWREKAIKRNF